MTRLDLAISDGLRDERALRLRLGPLSPDAAAMLVDGDERIVAAGAGNPFLLEQLARSRPTLSARSPTLMQVPEAVAAAVRSEVANLPLASRQLLEGAAVAGDPCDLDLAATAAGLGPDAALSALDELLRPGLLRRGVAPRSFAFRHPMVRETVEAAMPEGSRLAAHARAADALKARGVSPLRLARHLEHVAAPGDESAISLLSAAADEAHALAPAVAARVLGAALRLLGPDDARRFEFQRRQADALTAAGEPAEGVRVLLGALDRAPADEKLALTSAIANAETWLGAHEDARRRLHVVRASLPAAPSGARLRVLLSLGLNALVMGDLSDAVDRASDALSDARALDDRVLIAAALVLRTLALALDCRDEAHAAAVEAAAVFTSLTTEERVTRLLAYWMFGRCAITAGDLPRALALLDEGYEPAAETGRPVLESLLGAERARVLVELGQIKRALSESERVVDVARAAGVPPMLRGALTERAAARLAAGDVSAAVADAEAALDAGPPLMRAARLTEHVLALALGASGHPGRGADLLAPLLPGVVPAERSAVASDVSELLVAAGRGEEAARVGLEYGAVTAALRLARGDAAGAAEEAKRAAEQAASPLERERWSLLWAQARLAAGDERAAREQLIAVEARCAEFGAERLRSVTARELRRLGHRVRRGVGVGADEASFGGLTGRETEIVRLVAAGLSNREVAEQLVLSVKTVETHVRNVFAKLGVASRIELALRVQRAEAETLSTAPDTRTP